MGDTLNLNAETGTNNQARRETSSEPDPYDFSAAEKALNDAAKRVNAVWISFILLCIYIFIATYTVTPATLFREGTVTLPVFNADLPLKIYFVMAPILILAVHAYLIVLTKGLSERIEKYEDILSRSTNMPTKIAAGRRALRARLDNSIIIGAESTRYRDTFGGIAIAHGIIAALTMTVLPVTLLLLTQLIFLPYQQEGVTWAHRGFVLMDVAICLWLLWPWTAHPVILAGRLFISAIILSAAATSVFIAGFPGEWIYTELEGHWPHALTNIVFEGPSDPIDYVNKGGVVPFPNRLILPDDSKLAAVAGAPPDGVSLSVRGRNFRKAVFDRSNLVRVDFSAADLEGASLRGARLEGAKFECAGSAILTFYGPSGAYESTYRPEGNYVCTNLIGASLAYARLDRSSFHGAQLSGADLGGTTVTSADFSSSTLLGAQFRGAVGRGPKFSTARLIAANFSYAQLFAADFDRASLQGARLSSSYLQAANFRGSSMQGVDASEASLQGAIFERTFLHAATFSGANIQGESFQGAALPNASLMCASPFRSDFENANRDQAIVTPKPCRTEGYDPGVIQDTDDRTDIEYRLPTDSLPKPDGSNDFQPYGWGYTDYTYYSDVSVVFEFLAPEKLDDETFAAVLKRITSEMSEDTKSRVGHAFERLRPGARTQAQDDAAKAFWTSWAENSAPRESHEKALAARLESIACVQGGAPDVARGLLLAKRFDRLYENNEASEKEKLRIFERLRKASGGDDPTCLGAVGLIEADFIPVRAP